MKINGYPFRGAVDNKTKEETSELTTISGKIRKKTKKWRIEFEATIVTKDEYEILNAWLACRDGVLFQPYDDVPFSYQAHGEIKKEDRNRFYIKQKINFKAVVATRSKPFFGLPGISQPTPVPFPINGEANSSAQIIVLD